MFELVTEGAMSDFIVQNCASILTLHVNTFQSSGACKTLLTFGMTSGVHLQPRFGSPRAQQSC
jgi:hypothetical protein